MAGQAGPTSGGASKHAVRDIVIPLNVDGNESGRVAGVRLAEREGGLVGHFLDLRHGGELVAGDGGVADARGVGEHAVDVLRQTVAVHDREQAGFVMANPAYGTANGDANYEIRKVARAKAVLSALADSADTRLTMAASKRPRMSATGSSTVVMPATEIGPGMVRTESAE